MSQSVHMFACQMLFDLIMSCSSCHNSSVNSCQMLFHLIVSCMFCHNSSICLHVKWGQKETLVMADWAVPSPNCEHCHAARNSKFLSRQDRICSKQAQQNMPTTICNFQYLKRTRVQRRYHSLTISSRRQQCLCDNLER